MRDTARLTAPGLDKRMQDKPHLTVNCVMTWGLSSYACDAGFILFKFNRHTIMSALYSPQEIALENGSRRFCPSR